jgi:hypothetical protein
MTAGCSDFSYIGIFSGLLSLRFKYIDKSKKDAKRREEYVQIDKMNGIHIRYR